MPNIPTNTPMSPGLYGILQKHALPIVDRYWNLCIAALLSPTYEPNMYSLMSNLFRGGADVPPVLSRPNRTRLSDIFCQFWCGAPMFDHQPTDENLVKREAVMAMGSIYYDIVLIGANGAVAGSLVNGAVPYLVARRDWEVLNASFLAQELANLKAWIQAQPN